MGKYVKNLFIIRKYNKIDGQVFDEFVSPTKDNHIWYDQRYVCLFACLMSFCYNTFLIFIWVPIFYVNEWISYNHKFKN